MKPLILLFEASVRSSLKSYMGLCDFLKKNLVPYSLSCLLLILTLRTELVFGQNVGINTTGAAPHASAMLDVDANNRGLLIPRVSLTDVTVAAPVTSPATGLLVYNTNASVTGGNGTGF